MLGETVLQALVSTAKPEAAKTFYTETLGLKLALEDAHSLLFAGKIGFIRAVKLPVAMPATQASVSFTVSDALEMVGRLNTKGVRMERFAFLQQDSVGIWTAPNGAKVAWFRDPDMNLLSIMQDP